MLGQPMSMLIPQVLGFRLHGAAARGRDRDRPRADGHRDAARARRGGHVRRVLRRRPRRRCRSPTARRSATCRPSSARPARSSRSTPRRSPTWSSPAARAEQIALVEAYAREQGLWHDEHSEEPTFSDTLELDLGDGRAEPRRPQAPAGPRRAEPAPARRSARRSRDYVPERRRAGRRPGRGASPSPTPPPTRRQRHARARRSRAASAAARARRAARPRRSLARTRAAPVTLDGESFELDHGHVVIAAITSCTNTSNPSVMVGAGILARNALARGLRSQAVGQDLARARLEGRHRVPRPRRADRAARAARLQPRRLRLHDLHRQLRPAAARRSPTRSTRRDLAVVSVLSGNRNFEGRINPDVKMNYLASPPLCVAYALAGTMDIDIVGDPLGQDEHGERRLPARHLAVRAARSPRRSARPCERTCSAAATARCSPATSAGTACRCPTGERFAWDRALDLRAPAALLPGHARRAAAGQRHRGRARARAARRQRHHRPHLAGRLDQARRPRRPLPAGARRRAAGLQLLRLAPRQPRGDDARDVRQHPPAQPARRRRAGRCPRAASRATSAATASGRADVDLRRRDALHGRGHRRWSCSPARSTARAPRATGPPRARGCSACAR